MDGDFSLDVLVGHAINVLKLTLAFSPIIAIGLMLACGREDEEVEKEKQERAKTLRKS